MNERKVTDNLPVQVALAVFKQAVENADADKLSCRMEFLQSIYELEARLKLEDPKMNNLRDLRNLILRASKLQKITDRAVEQTLSELEHICPNKRAYAKAEAAALLFIYDGIDKSDKKITLDRLIENIEKISAKCAPKNND